MNFDEILKNIRLLSNGQKPAQDISGLLKKHNCSYLLTRCKPEAELEILNKICVNERYKACKNIFEDFEKHNVPYAVIKGAVLSKMAYGDAYCRKSGDIDLLLCRDQIDTVKEIMLGNGFVQGRVTDNGVAPFSRKELLFQTAMSHQAAPFIKKTSNPVCPYVNVDVNLDIYWGESNIQSDMQYVLDHTELTEIGNVVVRKLTPEMEFVALCLHHYKDANSIYLLWQGSLKLSLFCDVYFYLKHIKLDLRTLKEICSQLCAADYVYYCVFYADAIFNDNLLAPYLESLETDTAKNILNTFGLTKEERKKWDICFISRLFSDELREYLKTILRPEDMNKIKINMDLM